MSRVDTSVDAFKLYIQRTRSVDTGIRYAAVVESFLGVLKLNGINNFAEMPRGTLNSFVELLLSQGQAASTVYVSVSAVNRYLRWVEDQGVPVARLSTPDMPRHRHRIREVFPPSLLHDYFHHVDLCLEDPLRTACKLLPCTGLRANEMAELQLSSIRKVDVLGPQIVRSSLAFRVTGKGDKERTVPILEDGVPFLLEYLAGYRKTKEGIYLFPTNENKGRKKRKQKHITHRLLRWGFAKVRDSMGMEFTPHTMRRTYLVTLWRRGVDAPTIAKIAGHANIQTLYSHYLNLDEYDVVQAVQKTAGSGYG